MNLRALLAAAALAAAALAVPAASAAGTETVSGRVLDDAGKPVKGAGVTFERDDWPDTWFGGFFCLIPFTCRRYSEHAVTDAAGRYRITLYDGSPIADAGTRELRIVGPSGAATSTVVDYSGAGLRMPDLRLWHGAVSVDPDLTAARVVQVPPLPPEFGDRVLSVPSARLRQRGSGTVWRYGLVPYALPVDPRTVEAGTTHVVGTQQAEVDGYVVTYDSAGRPVTGGARPLSRGRSCFVYGSGGRLVRLPGCKLTDGRLATDPGWRYLDADGKRCSGCAHGDAVVIDLGTPKRLDALVARGCEIESAEVSPDGKTYAPLEPVPAGVEGELREYLPATGRYVRVHLDWPCSWLTEVSVFAPLAG